MRLHCSCLNVNDYRRSDSRMHRPGASAIEVLFLFCSCSHPEFPPSAVGRILKTQVPKACFFLSARKTRRHDEFLPQKCVAFFYFYLLKSCWEDDWRTSTVLRQK